MAKTVPQKAPQKQATPRSRPKRKSDKAGQSASPSKKTVIPAKAGIPFVFPDASASLAVPQPAIAPRLLAWYDRHARTLPWRAKPHETPDPYHVWLSEIMLQQTTVATVQPYFISFLKRWPTIQALARANLDEVLQAWAGLGYYRRARFLHACAVHVVRELKGHFPSEESALRELPGIGPYTAAAIAAIAFDRPCNVVDGNVERVMARLFEIKDPLPKAKPELRRLASTLVPAKRPGDYAQALMDLGATVCIPGKPRCALCPISATCQARANDSAENLPARTAPKAKPTRRALAFVFFNSKDKTLYIRKRPDTGLLASMMEVPSTPWDEAPFPAWPHALPHIPAVTSKKPTWQETPVPVRHVFTHFDLELRIFVAANCIPSAGSDRGLWVPLRDWQDQALPSVMRKIVKQALAFVEGGRERVKS